MNRDQIAADLKQDEGWRSAVYQDTEGYWTIGFGFMVDARKGGGMPKEIGEIWLNFNLDRLAASLRAAIPRWDKYPNDIQRALANMAYQLGVSGLLEFKKTLALIDEGRYIDAACEALNSRWAEQTPNRARRVTQWIGEASG